MGGGFPSVHNIFGGHPTPSGAVFGARPFSFLEILQFVLTLTKKAQMHACAALSLQRPTTAYLLVVSPEVTDVAAGVSCSSMPEQAAAPRARGRPRWRSRRATRRA